MRVLYRSLYAQVLVAVVLGILVGALWPETAISFKPLGDIFVKLVKMMIAPLVFCTIVTGIAGMENLKHAGRVGIKALIYFEVTTTLALIIGVVVVNWLQPGSGMHIDPSTLDTQHIAGYIAKAQDQKSWVDHVLEIIPQTFTGAFAEGNMLQMLFVSLLFGMGLALVGDKGAGILQLVQQAASVLFKIIGIIVRLAPLGAFGAMAFTIGKYGIDALQNLVGLMAVFYLTCILFIMVVLGGVMRLCGLRLWKFLKFIKEEIILVLGTSSSESALPRMMDKMERLGCSRPIVGMVIPTGYSFNLDGTSIYLTMAALFIAQALDIPLSLGDQLVLLSVLLLTSKGAAGVTGSGFVVLAGSLASVGHIPVAGLALILGIDRFMSEARAITNLIGNGVATVAIAKWEKGLDMNIARKALSSE